MPGSARSSWVCSPRAPASTTTSASGSPWRRPATRSSSRRCWRWCASTGVAVRSSVPPTIHALLQARIDSLDGDVRVVMERGAVEGEVFHRGTVAELAPDPVRADVATHLATLVRKELIRSTSPMLPQDEGFRFRHLLIRDAAYESLPKATRAELHERFADWLAQHDLVESDEIVGYHLAAGASLSSRARRRRRPARRARATCVVPSRGRRAWCARPRRLQCGALALRPGGRAPPREGRDSAGDRVGAVRRAVRDERGRGVAPHVRSA